MLSRGWRARMLWRLMMALAAGLLAVGGAGTAQASATESCGVRRVTASELGQPTLTASGDVAAKLNRDQGTIGTTLAVTGSGWPAGASVLVDLYVKQPNNTYFGYGAFFGALTKGTASSGGTIALAPFHAPPVGTCTGTFSGAQDGGDVLLLVHTADGRHRMPLTFTYISYNDGPQVGINSSQDPFNSGKSVAVTGLHWEPHERVTLTQQTAPREVNPAPLNFTATPNSAVSVTTDDLGNFVAILPEANVAPETWIMIETEGTGPRYGDVGLSAGPLPLPPPIFPSIHLDQMSVSQGGALTVTGDHWLTGQPGVIEYCRGENTIPGMVGLRCDPFLSEQLGTFVADGAGHFVAHVRLPLDARFGSVTVQARLPDDEFGLVIYAQAQPLAIAPTYAQLHPRREWVIEHAWYLAAGAIALLALLGALAVWLLRRRRGGGEARAAS
ncbi:MAG: hypothetical protein ACRDID_15480 [Ktedonobacterales bacterium]